LGAKKFQLSKNPWPVDIHPQNSIDILAAVSKDRPGKITLGFSWQAGYSGRKL